MVMPYGFENERLLVAVNDPANLEVVDKLRFILNREIDMLGFTNSHNPNVAIAVASITRPSNRLRINGTKITYNAVRNAEFDAVL